MADRLSAIVDRARVTLADPRAKALSAVVAIGLGLLGLIWPLAMAEVVVRIGAIGCIVLGTVWVFDLIGASSWVAGDTSTGAHRRFTPRRLALGGTTGVATFSLVLLLGGMSLVRAVRAPDLDRRNIDEAGCNTFVELCDLRVDQVAFAGTHNAMAASAKGWTFGRQTGGLLAQLSFGVRAFLLDLHYGFRIKDRVRTDFPSTLDRERSESQVPDENRAAVERALGMVGAAAPDDQRQVYLCHLYCELGATSARSAFQEIHDWLRVNPNEVILLVLEDHVSAEDAVEVLEDSGLADRAYSWVAGSPAPTLRQLIETKKNVIVMAENNGDAVEHWYLDAYDRLLQDTPYGFESMDEMADPASCAVGRGKRSAPLLMINHWLDTGGLAPKSLADEVNSTDVLLARAETCAQRRGQIPNIVAVDFYSEGHLRRVVNRLNRVDVAEPVLAATPGLPP